jgi:hypothetical protein
MLPDRQIRPTVMRHFSRHANAFAESWVGVNRLADVYCICTHFNRQGNLADTAA